MSANCVQQHRLANRLNEIVGGPQGETHLLLIHDGEDDDRNIRRLWVFSECCQGFEAIAAGHQHIQSDGVRPELLSLLDSFSSRLGHHNPVFWFQIAGKELTCRAFVINNQQQWSETTWRCNGRYCWLNDRADL